MLGKRPPEKDVARLGALRTVFRPNPLGWQDFLLLAGLGGAAVLLPLAYGWYLTAMARDRFGPAAQNIWNRPWQALAIGGLAILLALVYLRLRARRHLVAVHAEGIYLALSRPRALRWEEISGISVDLWEIPFRLPGRAMRCRARLHPNVGKLIPLDQSIPGLPELLSIIKAKTYPRLKRELHTDWQAGKWLFFGPLAISQGGLRLDRQLYPWPKVRRLDVTQGRLVVELPARTRKIPVYRIPNLELMLEMLINLQP